MTTATEPHPIFEAATERIAAERRLLLVSCVFPPDPSVGALRWQKLARFAAERRWALDVLMFDPARLPTRDDTRLRDLPAGTRVFGVPRPKGMSPSLLAAWRRFQRFARTPTGSSGHNGNGAAPAEPPSLIGTVRRRYLTRFEFRETDRFARMTARIAARIIRVPEVHRAVVSSGPPHMAHEAARRIAEAAGVPFVMDMRDPWCSEEVVPDFLHRTDWLRSAEFYERRCIERARLVIANTEPAAEALRARYPHLASRILTVMNGADDEPLPRPVRGTRFRIAFAGTLYVGRDPRTLFEAVRRVVRHLDLTPAALEVAFMGSETYGGRRVADLAAECGIADYFTFQPPGARSEALEFLASAAMLVNLPQHVRLAIPAKIFEYVRFDAWLLALAEPGSATEALLHGTGADLVDPNDVDGIAAVIRARFEAYRRGERPRALNADGRFDRQRQAEILFDALDRELA